MNYKIWITADYTEIEISKMDKIHILNTIRCLKGQSKTKMYHLTNEEKYKYIVELEEELLNRISKKNGKL